MFWGMLWGALGLVLAIPLTAAIKALAITSPHAALRPPVGRLMVGRLMIRSPMSKGFWIFLALGLAVVGGLIFTMLTATQGAHLRLEGKILKVRVLALPGRAASIVVVDFRVTNPSNVPFVVNSVTLHLEPATGDPANGATISKNDVENVTSNLESSNW